MKLKSLSTVELRKELAKREKQITLLKLKKNKLIKRIEKIDALIAEMEGQACKSYVKKADKKKHVKKSLKSKVAKKAVKEVKKFKSLGDVIAHVLEGKKAVNRAEAAKLALDAGYKSKSKQFKVIVGQTLRDDKRRFEKVGRGKFRVK